MKKYRLLIWFPGKYSYYDGIFKSLNMRDDVECKDKSDIKLEADYYSQRDYEEVQAIFHGNIVILYQVTKNELCIDIPDDVVVWTYMDDIFGKYVMVGKDYFNNFPCNNYLYLPLLDVNAYDIDHVMDSEELQRKAIFAPFVTYYENCDRELRSEEIEKFSSDIVIVSYKKRIGDGPFKYFAGVNEENAYSKDVMQLLGILHTILHREILYREHIITDEEWIERLLVKYFDEMNIWQYVRKKDMLLERWKRLVLYIINIQVYGNIIVDWIMERDYNLKLWGGWYEKKYCRYSMGYLQDGSAGMYYANKMSKIGINTSALATIHRRTFAVMESGAMCLSAAADTVGQDIKYNFSHYAHFFEDKKNIVMFHNKKELLDNIDYYLAHGEERKKIALAGKKVIDDQRLNYIDVVSNAFDELLNRIEEDGKTVI